MSRNAAVAIAVAILAVAILSVGCTTTPPSPSAAATDDSLYLLPFTAGTSHTCVQAGPGPFSHSGRQKFAVDFAMPAGTEVLAARRGRVLAIKEDSDRGGPGREMAEHGNYVRILHEDGSLATYLHLQLHGALVQPGEVVERGTVIGRSGSTGWSAMPHLHFQVSVRGEDGRWESIPVRFEEISGDGRPRFLGSYESRNRTEDSR